MDEGEELEMLEDYEIFPTILEHIKNFYCQYESMKGHWEETKDLVHLKISLGFLMTKSKLQMEPHTKAIEDQATTRARFERIEGVTKFLRTKKTHDYSWAIPCKNNAQKLKGEETSKRKHKEIAQVRECPSKRPNTRGT